MVYLIKSYHPQASVSLQNLAIRNGALGLGRDMYPKILQSTMNLVGISPSHDYTYLIISAPHYFDSPRPPFPGATAGRARLSFAPQGLHSYSEREPRTINNADNHFRFAQNLRQGLPLNQATSPRPPITQQSDQISQLANAMLLQRQIPRQNPRSGLEPTSSSHRSQRRVPNPLQPQKQQITPPFNLSEHYFSFPCANTIIFRSFADL